MTLPRMCCTTYPISSIVPFYGVANLYMLYLSRYNPLEFLICFLMIVLLIRLFVCTAYISWDSSYLFFFCFFVLCIKETTTKKSYQSNSTAVVFKRTSSYHLASREGLLDSVCAFAYLVTGCCYWIDSVFLTCTWFVYFCTLIINLPAWSFYLSEFLLVFCDFFFTHILHFGSIQLIIKNFGWFLESFSGEDQLWIVKMCYREAKDGKELRLFVYSNFYV